MVFFTENDVYEVLSFEWQTSRQVKDKLRERIGIANIEWIIN